MTNLPLHPYSLTVITVDEAEVEAAITPKIKQAIIGKSKGKQIKKITAVVKQVSIKEITNGFHPLSLISLSNTSVFIMPI